MMKTNLSFYKKLKIILTILAAPIITVEKNRSPHKVDNSCPKTELGIIPYLIVISTEH